MQSHQCKREICADKGADPVLINVAASLYPNCNGLWIGLEDGVSVSLQYADGSRAARGIAMQKALS